MKRQNKLKPLCIILSIFILLSCDNFIKSEAEKNFEETFMLIQNKSVKKNDLDWNDLKKTVRNSVKNINDNDDFNLAIAYTIKLVNDGHSKILASKKTNDNKTKKSNSNKLDIPVIKTKILEKNIGYIKLSGTNHITDNKLIEKYTLEIRKALLGLDKSEELSGWILDLRTHGGGRLSCESLGLAPLFDNPLVGIYLNNKNNYNEITCTNQDFKYGNQLQESLTYNSTLLNKNKKIAILIDKKTASSGEFLALAFKFQNNSKTFGKQTIGMTSHLAFYELKSGAILFLAQSYYYDINRNLIKEGIIPDVECDSEKSISKAMDWIKNGI
ncbi:S41 family peptidase [Mariniflexile litorale]|uniref:S41 family peptidase n=1 Tax=Mariniflexile litorale TaxID=3045158 RepID=A0AAU7EBF9_9FLAO|nr:S41 family peptidase [Mariniflexile sp. KMM 9835]MDQ8213526.1 S41 family peptidase [Mariniflexile sp. KMM 9835]